MSNEENMFDYPVSSDEASTESVETQETASTETQETEATEPVETQQAETTEATNEFDYSDVLEQMEKDASLSDEGSESETGNGEDNSTETGEQAENNSGGVQTEPTQAQLFQAAQLGLTLEEVQGLNGRELATAIRVADRLKPVEEPAEQNDETGTTEEPLFTPIALDGLDEFDEDTQGLVKGLQDQFNQNMKKMAEQVKQANSKVAETSEAAMQQGQAQFFEYFDGEVSKLGDGWHDVFGVDPNALAQGSAELQNRINLITEMDKLAIAHPEFGKKQLFDAALRLTFPNEMNTKREQQKTDAKQNHRRKRSTMPPTNRKKVIDDMPDGRAKALARVKEIGKKKKFFGLF